MSSVVIEGMHVTDGAGRSVSFQSLNSLGTLEKQLREDHQVYSSREALPVIVMTEPEGDTAGNYMGTVVVATDDEHRLKTIERAIRCLEAVREALGETGHHDHL